MNIIFLKLYITSEVNNAFYNSQEMGLAKALVEKHPDHHVDIVLLADGSSAREDSQDGRIAVHILPAKGFGHHGIINLDILKDLKADLVHLLADNMLYAPQVIDYCLKNNIKCHLYIGTLYTDSSSSLKQTASKLMMTRNLAAYKKVPVYAKTPFVQKQLNAAGIKAKLAPVGLDKESLVPSEGDVFELRERYGLPFGKKILLYVGRLEEYKRPLEAVELLRNLMDGDALEESANAGEHTDSSFHLLMIGDGELSQSLDERIKELGLQGRVRRIPKVPNSEMKDIYRACDFFVNFNRVEIYGMAILEAMVNGCPVLAMRAPGPEYLIDDGRTGFLCGSDKEMRQKIALLTRDENLRRDITDKARDHVVNNLTWEKCVEAFDDWNN